MCGTRNSFSAFQINFHCGKKQDIWFHLVYLYNFLNLSWHALLLIKFIDFLLKYVKMHIDGVHSFLFQN